MASVGGGIVILLIGLVIITLVVFGISCIKRPPPPSPPPSTSRSTPTTFHSSDSEEGCISPPQSPISYLSNIFDYEAIVVDSKDTPENDRQAILLYLCDWRYLGKHVRVGYLDRHANVTPAEWLQYMEDVPKVLCVCNNWFYKEWMDQTPGTLVAALRAQVTAVVHNRPKCISSKFVVVKLDESDNRYIPGYLQGAKSFLVNNTKDLAHNLTNVNEFDIVSLSGVASK